MKDMIKSSMIGIGIALTIFCLAGVFFDLNYGGCFSLENYQFTKMTAACVVIGLGFGMPSVVYRSERLPMPVKVLIHMGTGLVVYTVTACFAGWIGPSVPVLHIIGIAAVQIAAAFMIWFGFMRHYSREAQRMNERIQGLQGD